VEAALTATLELYDLTSADLARMMREAIQDRRYQRDTRLGCAVADYLAWARLRLAPRSLVIYEGYLARLCRALAELDPDVGEVTPEMLLQGLAEHERGSFKIVVTAYRRFFAWACLVDRCRRNPVDLLPKLAEPPMKVYDIFTATEQAKLIKAADQLPLPWVQRLRILCFIDLGIRSAEARGLRPADFDTVQRVVVVKGKGEKERVLPFGDDLFRAFIAYRNRPIPNVRMTDDRGKYREARPPRDDDYLFFPLGLVKATGAVTWADPFRQMADRSIRSWWDKVVENADVRYRSLHMNRHTLGTDLSTAGEGLETIQDWLGHADPGTTKVYVHNSRSRLNQGRGSLDAFRKQQAG
jgi:integrase/recombinase XerC